MIKVIIIGGNAAGCKTAARLSRLSSDYKITVIEGSKYISIGNCGLPLYAAGEIDNIYDLAKTAYGAIRDADYFREVKGINVLTNTEVVEIVTENKKVKCKDINNKSFTLSYDALVLAIGSKAIIPKFSYPKSPRISSFHSAQNAKDFRVEAQKGKVSKAVIIGGGFIGCELVEALTSLWGIETILIEKEQSLLSNFLDYELSRLIENRIKKNDSQIILSSQVEKIELDENKLPVVYLSNYVKIHTEYVFYNLGVKPNIKLAQLAGIKIGEHGGIIVDKKMRTNIPNVWAAGDCVETKNLITNKSDYFPLGSLANRMGRVVADSIAGKNTTFDGAVGVVSLKLFNSTTSAAGLTEKKASEMGFKIGTVIGCWRDRPDYHPEVKDIFGKLIYEKPSLRLLGLQLFGGGEVSRYVDVFSELLVHHRTAQHLIDIEHGYTPANSSPISPLNNLGYMVINQERDGVKNFNPVQLSSFDGVLTDVRERVEIDSFPFRKDAVNIPLSHFRNQLNELDSSQVIMAVCERGPRAYEAAKILINNGNKNVSYLGGGVSFYNELYQE